MTAEQLAQLSDAGKSLKPSGWRLRQSTLHLWMLEHCARKLKIKVWPTSARWLQMHSGLEGGGLHIPVDMPKGRGYDTLVRHAAAMVAA